MVKMFLRIRKTAKSTDELLREQAITDLTTTEALKQDAEKSKITVSDEEVNQKA